MQGFCVSVLFCFANVDVHCAFKAVLRRFSRRHAAHDTLGQTQTRDLVWRSALGQWAVETFVWQPARGYMRQRRAARWQRRAAKVAETGCQVAERVYNETAHCRQTTKKTRSATEIEWVQNYNDVNQCNLDVWNTPFFIGTSLCTCNEWCFKVLTVTIFILRVEWIVCTLVNKHTYKNIKHLNFPYSTSLIFTPYKNTRASKS